MSNTRSLRGCRRPSTPTNLFVPAKPQSGWHRQSARASGRLDRGPTTRDGSHIFQSDLATRGDSRGVGLDVSRAIHKWCASRAHTMAVGTDRRRTFSQARLGRAILVAIDQHYAAQGVKEMWLRVQNHLQSTVSPEDSGRDGPDIFARRPCLDAIIRANTTRQ